MPKAIYTAAKGLIESNDSDSGFSISGAGLYRQAQSVSLSVPSYTLDFTNVENVNDKMSTDGADDQTTAYHNTSFVLHTTDGTEKTIRIVHSGAGGPNTDDGTGTTNMDAAGTGDIVLSAGNRIADGNTGAQIATKIKTQINASSEPFFVVDDSAGTLTIFATDVGLLPSSSKRTVEAQSTVLLDIAQTTDAYVEFTVADSGAISRSSTYIEEDRNVNKNLGTTNAIHYAGWSEVDAADDVASMTISTSLDDGLRAGHEKFLRYNATSTILEIAGNFASADGTTVASGTKMTIAGGSNHFVWLVWSGTRWLIANASSTNNTGIVVSS